MTSDQIAALALIVSIAGFWVAYKSWYQSRKLIVAEKCTQVWHALVEARLVPVSYTHLTLPTGDLG